MFASYNCPSAVKGEGGNQRLVSEGTAITKREIWAGEMGVVVKVVGCRVGKGRVGEVAEGWDDGSLSMRCVNLSWIC